MKKYIIKHKDHPEMIIHAADEKMASFFYTTIFSPHERKLSNEGIDLYEEMGCRNSDIEIKEL